ncbi:MAG: filamentous hemagglutinin N-terminal domain-containing protein [Gammaproteobacteria bacterium]|nr:filamentous hemagglutinin N-terminal domain-containing protein [Gammaproteobacteria bacterium]
MKRIMKASIEKTIKAMPRLLHRVVRRKKIACFYPVGISFIAAIIISPLYAAPQGGEIVAGSGSIAAPTLSSTVINQSSQSMAINWQSFDVANGERVEFVQPSSSSTVLNRIQGESPSQIFGAIDANGHVFLINPHGILFGETATVNVGSLVASGLTIDTDAFMNGDYRLSAFNGTQGGIVINQGIIQAATGGTVTLVGSSVQNQGVIVARMGAINLGAGNAAVIDFDGDGLMRFEVTGDVQQNAEKLSDAVINSGTLNAEGGRVAITAQAARDVFTNVINNTGVIKATGIDKRGGTVRLTGRGGNVISSGIIDASSNAANTNGGAIELLSDRETLLTANSVTTAHSAAANGGIVSVIGPKVGLFDQAHINVSGATGGGTALVGGDFQGGNPTIQNADYTYIGENTVINANANNTGNGGKVIVWANEVSRYFGTISARGGVDAGHGGFVEVSGKTQLRFDGAVDVSASVGLSGKLLLDPDDLCITNGGAGSCMGAAEDNSAPFDAATAGSNSFILVTTLQGLGDINIDLLADDDIIFDTDLNLSASLTSGTLTLNADNDADGIGGISMAGFDLSTGGGNIAFNVNAAGEGITNIGTINAGGGSFTLNAAGAMTQNIGDKITGTTHLIKQGAGTLTLTEINDYTGSTTLEGGTLSITTDANLGTAPTSATPGHLVLNGGTLALSTNADMNLNQNRGVLLNGDGTLDVAAGTSVTYNGIIDGAGGTLTKANAGTLSLGGTNTYTTATHITLSITTDANLGTAPTSATPGHLVLNGGTLATNADMNLNQNRGVLLNGDGTLDVAAGTSVTYNGIIDGVGGTLTKANAGTLSLGGINTYTTATHINGGTLSLGASDVISNSSDVSVNGGVFNLNEHDDTVASLTISSGRVTTLTGTLTTVNDLTLSGANATLTATTGNLMVGGNVNVSNGVLLAPGATSTFNVAGNWSNTGAIFTHNNGTVVFDGAADQMITSNAISGDENSFFNVAINKTSNRIVFVDRVVINALTSNNAAYDVSIQGNNSIISTATVFNNTGNLTLGNDGDNVTFTNGATHILGLTDISGTVTATAGDLQFGASRLTGSLIATAGTVNTAALVAQGSSDVINANSISTDDISIGNNSNLRLTGSTVNTGVISGASSDALSNIDITASGAVTVAGKIGTDAETNIDTVTITADTLSLQGVNSTGKQQYTVNEIQLNGTLSGKDELVLQTLDVAQDIDIGGNASSGALELTAAKLAQLSDGFSHITIGRNDSTGTISVVAGSTVNFFDTLSLIAGDIDVTGATIKTNNNDLSLSSRVGNIALGQLDAGTGNVNITVAENVTSDGEDPNIIAKNLRVEGSGQSLFGLFVSPMKLSGITDTATFLFLKEAHTLDLSADKIIAGKNINIDNLSTAERIGTGQALGLSGVNFIDPALFSADFSLFGVEQSGLKLPSDQLE